MKKINLTFVCAALLLFTSFAFSSELMFDFDGVSQNKKQENQNIIKNLQETSQKTVLYLQSEKSLNKETLGVMSVKIEAKTEAGDWIEIKPVKKEDKRSYYEFLPQTEIRNTYSCGSRKSNLYSSAWRLELTHHNFPSYGGHNHSSPPPPNIKDWSGKALKNPFVSLPTPTGYNILVDWKTPEYATRTAWEAIFYGACEGTLVAIADIKVDLVEMTPGPNYILYKKDDYHPETHYGTENLIASLKTIANNYKTAYSTAAPIQINDMSLPWGGLFDMYHNWEKPHSTHRCGNQSDVRKIKIPEANRKKFIEIVCKENKYLWSEGDAPGEQPHYHLSVNQSEGAWCKPPKFQQDRGTQCCKPDGTVNQANLEICIKI